MMLDDVASTLTYTVPAYIQFERGVGASRSYKGVTFRVVAGGGNAATTNYAASQNERDFVAHFSKLKRIETDPALWIEDAPSPSALALGWANIALQQFKDIELLPSRVVASAEGGVAICFVAGKKYADIECLNDGAILGVVSNEHDRPIVWEVGPDSRSLSQASIRIREFIDPRAAEKNDHGR